ncbi:MAG: type II secretion system minor pseudopilin GspI [Pseudomonadota bacterium]|nr:type II secretion system minor pseudopilin GspI [Pseudomonadota bacterium]
MTRVRGFTGGRRDACATEAAVTRARGFTLIEVLVALAIVAIALSAALRASGVGSEASRDYRAHLLALWLADDLAAEHQARRDWPAPGVSEREVEMGGQVFSVREEIKSTPNPRFRRLEIHIRDAHETERDLRLLTLYLVPG